MEIAPFKPLIIPLEDRSRDKATIFNYVNTSWPEPAIDQPSPAVKFPIGTNTIMSMENIMM